MKKKTIKALTLGLAAILIAGTLMMTGCGKSYEYITGDVEWRSSYSADSGDAERKMISDTFYYSDDWFADDPSKENKELALCSMQLVAATVTDDEGNTGEPFLKAMGFEETGFSDFDSDDPDDFNYTWAKKSIDGGTLVVVAVQSSSDTRALRNKAWKQNFTVNDPDQADPSGEHYAYAKAVDKMVDEIAALGGDGATFWITGHSRGGAIANVLAARMASVAEGSKVFAYTFESPATVDEDSVNGDFKNIHNYVCSDDLVTLIPVWGMTRYGVTHDLKTKDTDEGLKDALTALGSDAADMNARIVTEDAVTAIAANFEEKVPDRADYSKTRTDKWTDADGVAHEVSYSYQEAFVTLMDLVFSSDASGSFTDKLSSARGDLAAALVHLDAGVKAEAVGKDASAEYWEGAKALYAVLEKAEDGDLPVSEEDVYKIVSFAAPVLITVPEGGGEPDEELLTDVIAYNRELTYSHIYDTAIARLKILAPDPAK